MEGVVEGVLSFQFVSFQQNRDGWCLFEIQPYFPLRKSEKSVDEPDFFRLTLTASRR